MGLTRRRLELMPSFFVPLPSECSEPAIAKMADTQIHRASTGNMMILPRLFTSNQCMSAHSRGSLGDISLACIGSRAETNAPAPAAAAFRPPPDQAKCCHAPKPNFTRKERKKRFNDLCVDTIPGRGPAHTLLHMLHMCCIPMDPRFCSINYHSTPGI